MRKQTDTLCSSYFQGRGYVNDGVKKAASYLKQLFETLGAQPLTQTYEQPFLMSVNTFPGEMRVMIDDKMLNPGTDYLVHPGSISVATKRKKLIHIDLLSITNTSNEDLAIDWMQSLIKEVRDTNLIYVLHNMSSWIEKNNKRNDRSLTKALPKGIFIIPSYTKPIWWVSKDTINANVIYLYDSVKVAIEKTHYAEVTIENHYVPNFISTNIVGKIKGIRDDSMIVVVAHYDHLGMMGNQTMFAGASDNASGVAAMLALMRYYSKNPPKFTTLFIAFAGEEAGLLGSEHFTSSSLIDLSKIKLLINLDIMGDATEGVTAVNATEVPQVFEAIQILHEQNIEIDESLKEFKILSRGPAANSDHHHFCEKNVPALFFYANSGKGYYHDVWDTPNNLSFNRISYFIELIKKLLSSD